MARHPLLVALEPVAEALGVDAVVRAAVEAGATRVSLQVTRPA